MSIALFTSVRSYLLMHILYVICQTSRLSELLVTFFAWKGPFACMGDHMILKNHYWEKPLVTLITCVRPYSSVTRCLMICQSCWIWVKIEKDVNLSENSQFTWYIRNLHEFLNNFPHSSHGSRFTLVFLWGSRLFCFCSFGISRGWLEGSSVSLLISSEVMMLGLTTPAAAEVVAISSSRGYW